MLFTVASFVDKVERDLNTLIDDLSNLTGRSGGYERSAWQKSLPLLSVALSDPTLAGLHLQLGPSAGIALEYRLPASASWCDAVLLGWGKDRPAVTILELKDWNLTEVAPGPRPGLIEQHGTLRLHPSEQVRGYVEYCRTFHSIVQLTQAEVSGCVFMTSRGSLNAFTSLPHDDLATQYPLFNSPELLAVHLSRFLIRPDEAFANAFIEGTYKQDRNFIIQVAKSITEPGQNSPQFVLLDGQLEGFERCLNIVDSIVTEMSNSSSSDKKGRPKSAVIIQGPPGSGKSVLAARLWATIAQDKRLSPQSVVFTTTSSSQRSNWERTFQLVSQNLAGRGIVLPTNRYNPGLSPTWVKAAREDGYAIEVETWRDNLKLFAKKGKTPNLPNDSITVAIVDEAHSLIDPSRTETRGIPPSGWTIHAGPQAYHILRTAQLSIFLMDSDQSYRDNESTRVSDIEELATEMQIPVTHINLADAQFRCAGSKEYIDWLNDVLALSGDTNQPTDTHWRETSYPVSTKPYNPIGAGFAFELFDSPFDLDRLLRERIAHGYTSRLVASYARGWKTKGVDRPHKLAPDQMDFYFEIELKGHTNIWSRIWNFAPNENYTMFIQAPPDSEMHRDPLCEVGCPYVVRGFDYDYLGVLWLGDLKWRSGQWQVDPKQVYDTGLPKSLKAARDGKPQDLETRIRRAYRILLSRAIRGVYVWCEDAETRDRLAALLALP